MTIPQKAARRQGGRRWRRWAGAWLALLAISHLVRGVTPAGSARRPGERDVDVAVVRNGRAEAGRVTIVFRFDCPTAPRGEVVLLLHGSPGNKADFDGIRPQLASERCVLAPDLPGFGGSSHPVPDYSFSAHAAYATALLDRLGVSRAHVVGFSMGGGVALSLARSSPERVASLTLLSAIGVQELELFGSYSINHVVHGLQVAALWLLFEATPHMGMLDEVMFDVPYARNFFDSDQRPLRDVLARFDAPTLVLHGRTDTLVPYEAAVEHHRLVPQSELVTFDGGHFRIFREPASLAEPLAGFLARVEAGSAPTRRTADPARIAKASAPFTPPARELTGLVLFVVLLLGGGLVTVLAAAVVIWRRRRAVRVSGTA